MSDISIRISSAGEITYVYTDEMIDLMREGVPHVTRASHVEPTEDGRWTADLSPVGGPVLGPFHFRESALKAEVLWLKENVIGGKV